MSDSLSRELSPQLQEDADEFVDEVSLRPHALADYVGQKAVLDKLQDFIKAATARGESLDHVLFAGPPGLGKTTLAHVIAHEMGVQLKTTSGPVIERGGDLAAIVSNLDEGDVLFVDEIHRLNRAVQEVLYPAMEDFEIDIILGQGPTARTIRYDLPHFTLVGATTRESLLSPPFRSRFGYVAVLDFYSSADLAKIISRSADLLEVPISEPAALQLASRCRGTPRIANRLLRRVRAFAEVEGDGSVDEAVVGSALSRLQVDSAGLDKMDRRILTTLVERFSGGPVGIESLAAAIGEDRDTLEDVYEPYLVQQGYIIRSRQGRIAAAQTYEHLKVPAPAGTTGSLF